MALDLWDVRRKVSQRNDRNKSLASLRMMEAFRMLLEKPSLESAQRFAEAEAFFLKKHPSNNKVYGSLVLAAIQADNYYIGRPKLNKVGLSKDNPTHGYVYFATSTQRPRQGKIGYTAAMTPDERCRKFRSRYAYMDFECKAWAHVDHPLSFEGHIQDKLRDKLVSGCVKGDSTEWYRCSRAKFIEVTVAVSAEYDLYIHRASWRK